MKLFQSIFLIFTIWVVTALLNATLCGTLISLFSNEFNYWPSAILMVFIFTLIFSIPGILIYWIILLVNWESAGLFRTLLKAGIIISSLSSLLSYVLPVGMEKGEQLFLPICIVIAAIASIMFHHTIIKSIVVNNSNKNYV